MVDDYLGSRRWLHRFDMGLCVLVLRDLILLIDSGALGDEMLAVRVLCLDAFVAESLVKLVSFVTDDVATQ
jgi:hypothetical protein